MRGSNGFSDPLIASSDKAPTTSAVPNTSSAPNSPTSPSAVDTCVPLSSASPSLGAEHERFDAGAAQTFPRGHAFAIDPDFADTDQRRRQVRERRQIARGTDRSFGGNTRIHARIDERSSVSMTSGRTPE